MKKIPKKFYLFSRGIDVLIDSERLSYGSHLGECCLTESKIYLCDKYKGNEVNEDTIADTFYHEKVHLILDAMGEFDLSKNEKFVEVFSQLLRQSDESAVFD